MRFFCFWSKFESAEKTRPLKSDTRRYALSLSMGCLEEAEGRVVVKWRYGRGARSDCKRTDTAVQGLRFSCYSWAPETRHPVHVTDVYATESRTPLVRELSADRFSVGLLLHCSPPSRVRAGEWAKVCGGQAPLWSAASAEKQRIFFLFRLQPTRHRYSLTHSTAHMNSCQSTK